MNRDFSSLMKLERGNLEISTAAGLKKAASLIEEET
jgi:hypothetical protein